MTASTNTFLPDYAVPPGDILQEELESLGLSHTEFAKKCGLSPELISGIIDNMAPIDEQSAIEFDRVLGGGADIWIRLEASYRRQLIRLASASSKAAPITVLTNRYDPDYAVSPGRILEDEMELRDLSQAELAKLCGCPPKLISEIISGKAPVDAPTAIQFDRVLGDRADVWLRIEAAYRLRLAQEAEDKSAAEFAGWAGEFPVEDLVKRDLIENPSSPAEAVAALLSFFRVGSVAAWQAKYGAILAAIRGSISFECNLPALAMWLRFGENQAYLSQSADYNAAAFRKILEQIRAATLNVSRQDLDDVQLLCREAGVALLFVDPLPGAEVSGATWWLSPRKPVIQLSAQHKTDDHLWFSLFHEAAHILLHSKKQVFIDAIRGKDNGDGPKESEAESEADAWAQNFLIPRAEWDKFAGTFLDNAAEVRLFAEEQGIAPGIIVGWLQREGRLPWSSSLNGLKRKLEWRE